MALYYSKKNYLHYYRGITSKHHNGFYCLNCLHSFTTENKRESHKQVCENKNFCNIVMSSEDTRILEFNQSQESDEAPFIIYADLECLIENINVCKNNLENPSTTKVPSDFSMHTISSFKSTENKHGVYKSKYCMKKFGKSLREHPLEVINFK